MVNPTTFPILRRGPSGPESDGGSPSGAIEPYDNVVYFDPETAATGETGSIADPFSTWAGWVGGVQVGSAGSWLVQFPGTAITPGADELPVEGINLILQGLVGSDVGTFINDVITIPSKDDAAGIVAFRDMSLEAVVLGGGDYSLTFRDCVVSDLSETDDFTGTVYGFDTEFLIEMVTPEAAVNLNGGSTSQWSAADFLLENTVVGSKDLSTGGTLTVSNFICRCHGVKFGPGSDIQFTGESGELWLDGPSYRSFIDSGSTTDGDVVRDDGNWPRASAVYTDDPAVIDWFSNPLARVETSGGEGTNNLSFAVPPLVREVQLMHVQDAEGGVTLGWPASTVWTDGVPPEQDLTANAVTIYRFFYEDGVYYGWVIGMNFLPE
jgi:hypothetical protein